MKEFSASASFQINDESIEELEEALESADKEYARQKKKLENKKFMLRCLTFGLLGKGRII